MAQKIITQLVDDIDGKELKEGDGETVTFSLDGAQYELDLSKKNADKLRGLFQDYIATGRKVAAGTKRKSKAQSGPSASEVRVWGIENGVVDAGRGRLGADLKAAYNKANPDNPAN